MEIIELDNRLDVGGGMERGGEPRIASRFLTWETVQSMAPFAKVKKTRHLDVGQEEPEDIWTH